MPRPDDRRRAPPRDLGEHFLVDDVAIAKIVDAAEIRRGDSVLDIGAGHGALAKACAKRGARVTAVEVQANLARQLRSEGFHVVEADALQTPLPRVDAVVANPPFGIAAPLLLRLLDVGFGRAVFVWPSELARRVLAKPGTDPYGRLTVETALRCRTASLFHLRRWVFEPPPEIPCVVVRVEPAPTDVDLALLRKVLEHAWASKRRTLRHGLGTLATELRISSGRVTQALRDLDLEEKTAVETSPEEYADLVRALA